MRDSLRDDTQSLQAKTDTLPVHYCIPAHSLFFGLASLIAARLEQQNQILRAGAAETAETLLHSSKTLTTGLRPNGHPHTGQFICTRYTSRLARNSGGGAFIAGLASKKPTGLSEKPIYATGITGQFSGRGM